MDTNNKGLVLKTPIGTPLSIVYHAEDRYLFIRNLNGSDSGRVVLNREDLPALIDYLVDIGFVERPEQLAPVVPESVRDMLDDALHEIAVGLDRAEANGERWYIDRHRSRWQDAKNWLNSLPVQAEPQATVDVPERVRQNMDVLYGHICANTYRDSPVRLAADMVYGYLNGAWSTPDREWLRPDGTQPTPAISDETIETLLHVIDYYRENAFVMDGSLRDIELESAESWLKSLPSMPPPSVPLEVQQAIDSCLDILQTYHSGNPFLSDPVTSEMEIVRSWRNALSQPKDTDS